MKYSFANREKQNKSIELILKKIKRHSESSNYTGMNTSRTRNQESLVLKNRPSHQKLVKDTEDSQRRLPSIPHNTGTSLLK